MNLIQNNVTIRIYCIEFILGLYIYQKYLIETRLKYL